MKTLIRILTVAVALVVAAPGQAQLARFANANGAIAFQPSTAASLVSAIRRQYGLRPVGVDNRLMRVAQEQANAMARRELMSHTVAGSFAHRMPGGYAVAAENIAAGSTSLEHTMELWRNSSKHLQNMLIAQVTDIGIAYAASNTGRLYFALVLAAPI